MQQELGVWKQACARAMDEHAEALKREEVLYCAVLLCSSTTDMCIIGLDRECFHRVTIHQCR